MITQHNPNSAWWGHPVGTVTDPAFFDLPGREQQMLLAPYAWVEFKAPLGQAPSPRKLLKSGFFWADVQVEFRIGLNRVPFSLSLERLDAKFAEAEPFVLTADLLRPFEHERFLELPGITPGRLQERYARWANQLASEQPQWCLQVSHQGQPQGWFLSRQTERGLNLTLAMLHRDAVVSGMHLYQKSLLTYASRGARLGWASFSIGNTSVLNIYARLGAHFTPPLICWLWVPGSNAAHENFP